MRRKPEFVSVTEAAKIIGVSKRRVQKYCQDGRLGVKVGGNYVITRKAARQFKPNPSGIHLDRSKK